MASGKSSSSSGASSESFSSSPDASQLQDNQFMELQEEGFQPRVDKF